MPDRTRDRILDGALEAVARHGLAKLEMTDVSAASGVSRGTVYRYFPNRDALVSELAVREGLRFQSEVLAAVERAPAGPARILVVLRHATQHAREHPVLRRLLETDPAFLLRALRAEMPLLRSRFGGVLRPLLADTHLVRSGVASADDLLDWMLRLMVSAFLFPESDREDMAEGLTAVYRMLTAPVGRATGARASSRTRTAPSPATRRERMS